MNFSFRAGAILTKAICVASFAIAVTTVSAQDSAGLKPLTFSGYAEAYYSFDFSEPALNRRPAFLYNYDRHNEFNLNLGFIKAAYNDERFRANLAIAAGTYVNANYAAEPGVLKNVLEANAGLRISRKKNIWFDIGIMPSHIGFESAIGRDNHTVTRSLVAENSPYFQGGAKVSYTSDDGRLYLAALALNGWQRVTRVDGNSMMSWGTQVSFKPTSAITFNYSSFFGTDKPDSARLFRTYHNFYGIFQLSQKIGFTAGFDLGTEEQSVNGNGVNTWYTPVAILHLTPSDKWAFGLRGEFFKDRNGVIISSGTPKGFETIGVSANIDYLPLPNASIRLECRNLHNAEAMFINKNGSSTRNNTAVTMSLAIAF